MANRTGVLEFKIPSYSRSVDKIFDEAQVTGNLNLCGRKLKEYPKTAGKYNLRDVTFADLSKNRFSELPSEVCDYVSLEKLFLYNNAIKCLNDSLASLHYLTHLILSRNQLTVLPSCICYLSNLKVLDVSGNRLVSLPEELGFLTRLTILDASYNQIQHLPPSLGDLDELIRLELRRNHIQQLPTEICYLHLSSMDLSFNRISSLPTELRFMSTLLTLLLDSNPLVHPPAHVCSRGRVHIFKWLDHSAAKEDKKRMVSEDEFRQSRKLLAVPPLLAELRLNNGFTDDSHKRATIDSGYSTSESSDNRWSHGSQELFDNLRSSSDAAKDHRFEPSHHYLMNGNEIHMNGINEDDASSNDFSAALKSNSVSMTDSSSSPSTPLAISPSEPVNVERDFNKMIKIRHEAESNSKCQVSSIKSAFSQVKRDGSSSPHQTAGRIEEACQIPSSKSTIHSPHYPSSNDPSLPHNPDPGGDFAPSLHASSLRSPNVHVHTYREYLEAKRQQRALDSNNIYKKQYNGNLSQFSDHVSPYDNEEPNVPPSSLSRPFVRTNGSLSSTNLHLRSPEENSRDLNRATVKSIQKEAVLSYVKARVSPTKSRSPSSANSSFDSSDNPPTVSFSHNISSHSSPIQNYTTSNSYAGTNGSAQHAAPSKTSSLHRLASPSFSPQLKSSNSLHSVSSDSSSEACQNILKARKKSGGGKPFEPDRAPQFSFTYRREIEKQQHEKQLIGNLREIIETRLKVSLPSDLSSALMDGVVLCHLVNHVRPRAVSSIHVPSPVVPKLTIAKCRLNVENFLEACRRIGIEEALLCSCDDIVTQFEPERVLTTVHSLLVSPLEVPLTSNGTCHTTFSKHESLPLDSMNNLDTCNISSDFSPSSIRLEASNPPLSPSTFSPVVAADNFEDGKDNQSFVDHVDTRLLGMSHKEFRRHSQMVDCARTSKRDHILSLILLCIFLFTLLILSLLSNSSDHEM